MGDLDVRIRHGGGGPAGGAAAVIVLLLFIAVGARAAWPDIVHTVEVIAWTAFGVTGTAAVITGTVLTTKAVRRHRARRAVGQPVVRATVIPPARPAVTRPASPPALAQRQRQGEAWPLPGWWEEIRPRIGGDGDEHRPR